MDSNSHQPIEGVRVARINASQQLQLDEPPKGGQLMKPTDAVFTASDGTFKLESLRDIAVFGQIGWYSVTLSFESSAYRPIQMTYTLAEATNNSAGEPVVRAGNVALDRRNH